MRATVELIPGHTNVLFQRSQDVPADVASWDPDESAEHAAHEQLHPGCVECVIATGDWKLVSLVDPNAPEPEREKHTKKAGTAGAEV